MPLWLLIVTCTSTSAVAALATWIILVNRLPNIRRRWVLVPEDGIGVTVGPFWTRAGAIDARRRLLTLTDRSYDLVKR